MLERLHSEIKSKGKELSGGAVKGSKAVDKARNTTQKHIELLGQHTAALDASGGKVEAANDPYVIQRGIKHRLGLQVAEENNNRNDLIAVQKSFQQFEAHVLQTIQQAMAAFSQYVCGQAERQRTMYGDMVSNVQRIPPDFEWQGFIKRNGDLLVDPSVPQRSVSSISFPNQNHAATQPLIAGVLERKSRLRGYNSGYYVVTPAGYLHEFKDDDDFRKDPSPELSLYLPECTVGGINGEKFNVKGKDASKGKVGAALAMSHELAFRAPTPSNAEKWWSTIRKVAGEANMTGEMPEPDSPVESRNVSGQQPPMYQEHAQPAPVQTQGLQSGGPQSAGTVGSGAYGTPHSAGVGGQAQMPHTGAGYSPATGAPGGTSGLDRGPGQY